MNEWNQNYTIYAVKAAQPWEEGANYWIPRLYDELKEGRARFGWGGIWESLDVGGGSDLRYLKGKIDCHGMEALSEAEREVWKHAKFLLDVQPGDFFIYINMPEYGKCTIVKITGEYDYDEEPWDPEKKDDFRHRLPCEFVASFDRNADIVHPYLRQRLKLQGAWYRIYAKREFEELLEALKTGATGKMPEELMSEVLIRSLNNIADEVYRHFPQKNLEGFVRELLSRQPYIKEVKKGPDRNGADLELELEIPIGPTAFNFLCAVQVKSYIGTMDYKKAVEDIRKAFTSNPQYACGLIVSTAQDYTEEFEAELEKVRNEFNKPVEVLLGKDIAYALVLDHMTRHKEETKDDG